VALHKDHCAHVDQIPTVAQHFVSGAGVVVVGVVAAGVVGVVVATVVGGTTSKHNFSSSD
jgi:hypothetical protein